MKHSTPKPSFVQRDMFSIESAAPQIHNPELGVRRVQIDGTWFFSIIDIFSLYGDTTDARQEWKTVEGFLIKQGAIDKGWEKRSDVKNTQLLMHKFEGQGQRNTPIGTFKMIMRIAQVTTFKGWESARDQMAQLAEERVEEIHNPELGVRRAHARFIQQSMSKGMTEADAYRALAFHIESTTARSDVMAALKEVCIEELAKWQYAQATNTQYETLYGMTAKQISEITGSKNAKQGMTPIGKQFLLLADTMVTEAFKAKGAVTFKEGIQVIRETCEDLQMPIANIERRLGISIATGQALIGVRK